MYYSLAEKLSTFCLCPETLQETEIRVGGLIELVVEIPRLPSVQAEAWMLLADFSSVCTENQEQKAHLKSFQLPQEGKAGKIGVEESFFVEKIRFEEKTSTLPQDSKKGALKPCED